MHESNEVNTFLSPDIKLLFDCIKNSNQISIHTQDERTYIQNLIEQWELRLPVITKDFCLGNKISMERLEEFVTMLNELSPLHTASDFSVFNLSWIKMESLDKIITWLSNPNRCYHYMALLQICSVMERILGKIYQLVGNTVPFLLRDIIDTNELEAVLEKEMVQFLKIFIGSVHGFNFRNIAWHGFLGIEDIHKEHTIVLLYSLHKCGEILKKKNLNISCFSTEVDLKETLVNCETDMKKFEYEEGDPLEIITKSKLVYRVMLPLWQEAVYLMSIRNHDALLLLLPLLENSLRVLYATLNGCSHRILTATDSAFYITMDEILIPWIKPPKNEAINAAETEVVEEDSNAEIGVVYNLVPQYLGRFITESLYDLFHYVFGPRLRDRISHGELLPEDVPFETICHLFQLCLLVLSVDRWRFSSEAHIAIKCSCESFGEMQDSCSHHYPSGLERILINSTSVNSSTLSSYNSFLISYMISYKCTFHPASILKRNVMDILFLIKRWTEWKCPPDILDLSWDECALSLKPTCDWAYVFGNYSVKSLCDIEEVIKRSTVPLLSTLFSSKIELEIVRTLQRIVNSIKKSLDNIENSLQTKYTLFISKSLRSRQRETYIKQLSSIPTIIHHLFINIQIILFILESYYHWRHVDVILFYPIKKMLKNVLKVVENLVSFTDSINTNYHAALVKLKENTQVINDYFQLFSENSKV